MDDYMECPLEDFNKAIGLLRNLKENQITVDQIETPMLYIMYTKCLADMITCYRGNTCYSRGLAIDYKKQNEPIEKELKKRGIRM